MLENWANHLRTNNQKYKLSNIQIGEFENLLVEYFGIEYFKVIPTKLGNHPKYEHQSWLKFLLTNFQPCYVNAALEICCVLQYLKKLGFDQYIRSKIRTKKNRVNPQVFRGNYHELFTTFMFLKNGIEYIPDFEMKKVTYDGVVITEESVSFIIEAKEIKPRHRLLVLQNANIEMLSIIEQFALKSLGEQNPLICGYFVPETKIATMSKDTTTHLTEFRYRQSIGKKYLKSSLESGLFVTDEFQTGLYENYPIPSNKPSIKFKTGVDGVEHTLSYNKDDIGMIERLIKGAIQKKRNQHKNVNAIKILCISMTSYLFGEPFDISLLEKHKSRILSKLGKDTVVLLLIRNLLNPNQFEIMKVVLANDNLKTIKSNLEKMEVDFSKLHLR